MFKRNSPRVAGGKHRNTEARLTLSRAVAEKYPKTINAAKGAVVMLGISPLAVTVSTLCAHVTNEIEGHQVTTHPSFGPLSTIEYIGHEKAKGEDHTTLFKFKPDSSALPTWSTIRSDKPVWQSDLGSALLSSDGPNGPSGSVIGLENTVNHQTEALLVQGAERSLGIMGLLAVMGMLMGTSVPVKRMASGGPVDTELLLEHPFVAAGISAAASLAITGVVYFAQVQQESDVRDSSITTITQTTTA